MGLFGRKKKTPGSISPSPTPSVVTVVPSPPVSPSLHSVTPKLRPQTVLRVAVDPASITSDSSSFTISVDSDADLTRLRQAISEHVGTKSMSLFKVAIPTLAISQALEYRRRTSTPVNLLTSFPAFNMDDARQMSQSFGLGWLTSPPPSNQETRVCDWFPESPSVDIVSILIRTSESSSSQSVPLTLIAHFAPSNSFASMRPTKFAQKAPTVVTVSPSQTVRELKSSILRADGRQVVEEHLRGIVLWQVEMSEEEMVIIGERGGLDNGRMPWPYPPGAPVPIAMSDESLVVSHYFSSGSSNARMVSVSIWLDAAALAAMPAPTQPLIAFKYPMDFAVFDAPASAPVPKRRQRPSTAPAVVLTSPGQERQKMVPAFGSRSVMSVNDSVKQPLAPLLNAPNVPRLRAASPLSRTSNAGQYGLGIDNGYSSPMNSPKVGERRYTITRSNSLPRGSVCSTCSSNDEDFLPRLSFSQLSLSTDPNDKDHLGPLTPEAIEPAFEWSDPIAEKKARASFADQRFKNFAF